jgi:hypothetical protein
MNDLFGNDVTYRTSRAYRRDSTGKFANKRTSELDKYKYQAAMYKLMYERELSRTRGVSKIIRLLTNEINKLKSIKL